jgi:nitroreductase
MDKLATVDHEIAPLLRKRWSPRAFSDRTLDQAALRSLLEAARWSASCFNEQPWRFVVAERQNPEEFERLLSCLNETNRRWAKRAAVLMLSVARTTFTHNGKQNPHAVHDVGLAVAQLTLQATELGIGVHQMAGFSSEQARETYSIPVGFEPVTVIAMGYPADPKQLPEDLREREAATRSRRPQPAFVFRGTWENPL